MQGPSIVQLAVVKLAVAGLVYAGLLPAVGMAQEDESRLSGSVRVGAEFDDNPLRLQQDDPRLTSNDPRFDFLHDQSDVVARYFARIESRHRAGSAGRARLRVHHGGKFFGRSSEADMLLTQVMLDYRHRLFENTSLLFDADVKDRTERLSRLDYNRGGVRVGLGYSPDRWQLSARAGWRYFAYKPAAEQGSQGPQFQARARRYLTESLAAEASYGLLLRDFDGDRQDTYHMGRAGVSFRSEIFVDVMYLLTMNRSSSNTQDLTRHGLLITVNSPLFEEFYGSARLELQRTDASARSEPDALFFVDEENRNVLVMSMARPFGESWEIEGRWSLYSEEFSDSRDDGQRVELDYSRQTFLLALGWVFE